MKAFFRRFWWLGIILGIGLILLVLTAYGGYKDDQSRPRTAEGTIISTGKDGQGRAFTTAELKAAEAALANGIKIEDPQNDWYQFPEGVTEPDGRPDNPDPYPLGWTDYRSVSVGSDQNYIYFKFQYWGPFPQEAVNFNGDLIRDVGGKITNFAFINQAGERDSADLGTDIMFLETQNGQWVPARQITIGHGAMISPAGLDEQMETLFQTTTSAGMVAGGPGHDYLLAAYPLSLFNLKPGDQISFDAATETGSFAFHHEAVDLLLNQPGGKFGATIIYTLGANTYATVENPNGTK